MKQHDTSTPAHRFEKWIYNNLGDEWCGNPDPPGSQGGIDYGEVDPATGERMYVFRWHNDGFEAGLGFREEWHTFMRREDARRIAFHVLWSDVRLWFGLRRKLWYWSLTRSLDRSMARREEQALTEQMEAVESIGSYAQKIGEEY